MNRVINSVLLAPVGLEIFCCSCFSGLFYILCEGGSLCEFTIKLRERIKENGALLTTSWIVNQDSQPPTKYKYIYIEESESGCTYGNDCHLGWGMDHCLSVQFGCRTWYSELLNNLVPVMI